MTEKQAIKILLDRVTENIFNMSANYAMTVPRSYVDKEAFKQEKELEEILVMMLEQTGKVKEEFLNASCELFNNSVIDNRNAGECS